MKKHDKRRSHEGDAQAAGYRHERLSRIFREEVAALLRDEVTDPTLDGVTITYVELSVDYKNARLGFTGPGGASTPRDTRERMARALARAAPFLRARLLDSVELKQAPALRFTWDAMAMEDGELG